MKNVFYSLVSLLLLGLVAGTAGADLVEFEAGFLPDAGPQPIMFPQFDPALGVLTEVTLTLSGGAFADGDGFYTGPPEFGHFGFPTIDVGVDGTVSLSPGLTVSGSASGGAADLVDFGQQVSSLHAEAEFTESNSTSDLGPYIGTGTIDGTGQGFAFGNSVPDAFSDVAFLGVAVTEQTATLGYTFTPIPEPSTFALTALGLIGLGTLRSRRRSWFLLPNSGNSSTR